MPFGTGNGLGSQSGGSLFGSTSTGVFGQPSSLLSSAPAFGSVSSPGFGSSTPTFGSSSSCFGGSSAFGGFGPSTQTSPCGSSPQQSQPAFGSNLFGPSPSFGASSQPSFGGSSTSVFGSSTTPFFGSTGTPSFGMPSTPSFGSAPSQTFGNTSTGFGVSCTLAFGSGAAFGSTSSSAFGNASAFGASTNPAVGATTTPAFGASATPTFGAASTPSLGSSSTSSFNFGSTSSFGQSAFAFGSSPIGSTPSSFGAQSPSFGSQASTPTFGGGGFGQPMLGGQRGGSRVASYTTTPEADSGIGTQPAGKLLSISAMPVFKDKSHEELRWEDYHHGNKGGPNPAVQSTAGTSFGVSDPQANPLNSSTFGQSSANSFSASVPSNPFASKPSGFGTTGFGSLSAPKFAGTPTPSAFGSTSSSISSIFTSSTPAFGSSTSSSLFGTPSSSGIGSTSLFGSTPTQGIATPLGPTSTFGNTQSSPLFQSAAPSLGQIGAAGQSAASFGQTAGFGQPSISSTPSTGFGTNLFSSMPSFSMSNQLGIAQSSVSLAVDQAFWGGVLHSRISSNQNSAVARPAAVANPFGALPATPQMSIVNSRISPLIQYGISSMPVSIAFSNSCSMGDVVDKPASVRISPLLTSRHLSQRRIRLPVRKYHPKTDGSRASINEFQLINFSDLVVPFLSDNEAPATAKPDAHFIPRQNPRALVIQTTDHRSAKSPIKEACLAVHENVLIVLAVIVPDTATENGSTKEQIDHTKIDHYLKSVCDESLNQNRDSCITSSGLKSGEAATVNDDGANIEAMMPKLQHSDYYTEPRIQELAAKERAEPGFCRRVKDFVVGRYGYGSVKFHGETDVRCLDLDSLVQFNNREVIAYMDESKKPPVGQGLNKPAEVTLLNIKCFDKKTGGQILERSKIEQYKEMLKKKAEEQGAEFLSYNAIRGEWNFSVNHFSKYVFYDEDGNDIDAAGVGALYF
ncbi:hypothetical protein Cgig2_010166 [Carnegiea gigantea]|uniref:Nucleoporin autopeptidase n=1 Tax=Carnegiea gigantea TaxID=171969 RepID=A0A9Q1KI55_9CARY|nr:hypothetical protein Cgig2_010166 [Carnegiea gigantea]